MKDVRGINVTKLGKSCFKRLGKLCIASEPFLSTPITKEECLELKDELNISGCYYDDDYWSGVAKACGGTNNMPSLSQLADIASHIYGVSSIVAEGKNENLRINIDFVSELGIITDESSKFYIWSNEENGGRISKGRSFYPTYTEGYNINRQTSNILGLCLNND